MRDELAALFGARIQVEEADVDSRSDWRAAHGPRIPVLLGAEGRVLSETRLDAERVRAALAGTAGILRGPNHQTSQ